MSGKVLVDGAVATKQWRSWVSRAFLFFGIYPLILLPVIAGILWFVSLGHVNLLGVSTKPIGWWIDKVFPETKEEIEK